MKKGFNFYTFLFVVLFLYANTFSQDQDSLLLIGGYSTKGLYGYINRNGDVIIEPKYISANDFKEGVAVVVTKEEYCRFIDQTDRVLYQFVGSRPFLYFSEGLITIEFHNPSIFIFMDRYGKVPFSKTFEFALNFQEGLACVEIDKSGRRGFINKLGKLIIEPNYFYCSGFNNGYDLAFLVENKIWGILDTTGKFIPTPTNLVPSGCFSNGLIPAIDTTNTNGDFRKGLWGYLNTKSEVVIPPKYFRAGNFSEGLASVASMEGSGYIDTTGKLVIKGNYAAADLFSEGLAAVYIGSNLAVGERNAFINKKGEVVFSCDVFDPQPFKKGVCKYWDGYHFSGDIGYISNDGKVIWPKLH